MKSTVSILAPVESKSQQVLVQDRWLTVREAAAILRVHPISIYRSCSAHRIPHVKAAGVGVQIDKLELDTMFECMGSSRKNSRRELSREKNKWSGHGLVGLGAARLGSTWRGRARQRMTRNSVISRWTPMAPPLYLR